jgi:hypothetical protein
MIIICKKINIFLGNFKQLCKLLAKSNKDFGKKLILKPIIRNIIQDELFNICVDVVKEIIVKDIEDV